MGKMNIVGGLTVDGNQVVTEDKLPPLSDIATNQSVDQKVANLVNSAPEALDTLGELATALNNHEDAYDALLETVGKKVDKVEGKGLSTNDYTTVEKNKLASIANTISLTGDVTGSATFNGNGTLSISTTVVNGGSGGGGTAELPTIIIKSAETSGVLDAEAKAKFDEVLTTPAMMHLVFEVQTEVYGGFYQLRDIYQFSRIEVDEVAQAVYMVCSCVSSNSTKILKVQIVFGGNSAWHITTASSGGGGGATLLIQGVDPALPMGEITTDQMTVLQSAVLPFMMTGDASQLGGLSAVVMVGQPDNIQSLEVYKFSSLDPEYFGLSFTTQSPLGTKTLMFDVTQGMWMIAEPNHLLISIEEGQTSGQISFAQLIGLQANESSVLNSAVSLMDANLNMSTYRFVETDWAGDLAVIKYSKITDNGISILRLTSTGEADEGGLPITTWEVTTTPFAL